MTEPKSKATAETKKHLGDQGEAAMAEMIVRQNIARTKAIGLAIAAKEFVEACDHLTAIQVHAVNILAGKEVVKVRTTDGMPVLINHERPRRLIDRLRAAWKILID